MITDFRLWLCLVLMVLLAGCGGGEQPPKEEKNGGVIPEHQLQALDKAEGVEQMMQDAEQARQEEMEKQGI